jgi:hypothetical protein
MLRPPLRLFRIPLRRLGVHVKRIQVRTYGLSGARNPVFVAAPVSWFWVAGWQWFGVGTWDVIFRDGL